MPTYEYECPSGHVFEKFQKMTDKPRAKCPVCGKIAARKISGGAGLVFKGSGFYITDYGKDGKKKQGAPTSSNGESSGSGGEAKSESKSESKSAEGSSASTGKPSSS